MRQLHIAEKPSLARAIVDGLVANTGHEAVKRNGYYEVGDDVVTYCVGHLLENVKPDEINPAYKHWNMADLPMKLTPIKLKPKKDTESQLKVVASLLPKAQVIVNAGDPDDEGQLLVDEVLEYYGVDPDSDKVLRVLINDVNIKPVQEALNNLKPNKDFAHMRHTAQARSYADYVYGMNLSRGYTLKAQQSGFEGQLSVGRVQTVVHGLIVKRYRAHNAFTPSFFYRLFAQVKIQGKAVGIELVPPENAPVDDKGRIISESYAKDIAERLKGKVARVESVIEDVKKQAPEQPLSLLKLTVRMGKIADMEGDEVLKATQALYETHKASSYPRTDNRFMSEAQWEAAAETFKTILKIAPELSEFVEMADPKARSKAVNDKKTSAHTAIIPVVTGDKQLSKSEQAVYTEIARFYLAQFLPTKDTSLVKADFDIDGLKFVAKGKNLINAGWSLLLSGKVDDEPEDDEDSNSDIFSSLSGLKNGDELPVTDITHEKGATTPPELYTSSSLMNDLPQVRKYVENAELREIFKKRDKERGGDNAGIGTPATRAGILPTLKKRGLYDVVKKKLVPTKAGEDFFDALPSIIVNPDITALWAIEQEKIVAGEITVDQFVSGVEKFVDEQIALVRVSEMKIAVHECPVCKKPMRKVSGKFGDFWACTGFRDDPQCKTSLPDYKGEPDYEGKGKAATEAKKVREEKATTCPKCKKRLKRLKSKKTEGEFYWACEGVFDKSCTSFFPDTNGKPELKPKTPKKKPN